MFLETPHANLPAVNVSHALPYLSSNLVEIPIYGILTVRDADKGHDSLRKPHD